MVASPAIVWFVVSVPYEHFRTYATLYYIGIMAFLFAVLLTKRHPRGEAAGSRWVLAGCCSPVSLPSLP